MSAPRVVLDTNVLVSALLFHNGSLAWIRRAWQAEVIIPLASRGTAAALIRVLAYPKFRLTDDEREDLLGDYLPWCETVTVPEDIDLPECRDPSDLPFLALAIGGKADTLVAGDEDILALADDFNVPILSPARFRVWMRF